MKSILVAFALITFMFIALHFLRLREPYMDYSMQHLAVPTAFYNFGEGRENMYFIEMKDQVFQDLFTENKVKLPEGQLEYIDKISDADNKTIIERSSQLITDMMNRTLPSSEIHLFHVVTAEVKQVQKHPLGFVTALDMLIHRPTKMYGIYGSFTVFHPTKGPSSLIDFKLHGFVFEDKIYGGVLPSNLPLEKNMTYQEMIGHTFLKSKDWEEKQICKYLTDMKTFRGIDYTSLGSYTSCEAKSSSTSS